MSRISPAVEGNISPDRRITRVGGAGGSVRMRRLQVTLHQVRLTAQDFCMLGPAGAL